MFTSDCLNVSQLRKITRRTNNCTCPAVFIKDRLDRDEKRTLELRGIDFDCRAARVCQRLLYHACFSLFTGAENLAALASQQSSRMHRLHCRTGAIYSFQLTCTIKNKNTVRHRIESRLPFALAAGDHFKQLSLGYSDRQSFCKCLYQRNLILRPIANPICLMNTENTAELSFNDERVVDLRSNAQRASLIVNIGIQSRGSAVVVETIIDDQRRAGSKQITTCRIIKAGFDILDARDTICQIFMFQRCAY